MNSPFASRRGRPARPLQAALAAAALLIATTSMPAAAQMGGMGGMGGKGPPSGGGPGGGRGGTTATPQEQPTLDDLMAPDPWRIWLGRLQMDSARLALTLEQQPVFDNFLRELDMASQFNAQRVARTVRHRPQSVSAAIDISRDLHQQSEEAQDWLATLADLRQRWEALRAVLNPEQQGVVDTAYRAARDFSTQAGRSARR